MKFIIFYAFVCTAASAADTKTNLRKPVVEPEVFYGKLKKTTCRDGSQCSSDKDCKKRGLNSKCKEREASHPTSLPGPVQQQQVTIHLFGTAKTCIGEEGVVTNGYRRKLG
jgi:hypothetical protein